jgi:hypothetical protein
VRRDNEDSFTELVLPPHEATMEGFKKHFLMLYNLAPAQNTVVKLEKIYDNQQVTRLASDKSIASLKATDRVVVHIEPRP